MTGRVLPNLIIAGVNKGGTTSLFSYLSGHPDVCASSIKETGYFLSLRYGEEMPPMDEYIKYFRHYRGQKYIMEATPGYFYGGAVIAQSIKETLGDVKILIVFRDPVDRLLSFYKSKKSAMELDRRTSFDEYIHICESLTARERGERKNNKYWGIQGGFYADYINEWFNVFGNSIKIVFFEQLKENPVLLLKELCEWLHTEHTVFDSMELETENRTVNYRNKVLHRIALVANSKGEELLRAHPGIKKIVRRLYYALNGSDHKETISDATLAYLKSVFVPYNRRLTVELSKRGYSNLPNWLSREMQEITI